MANLEFFVGGVPAKIFFFMDAKEILRLVNSSEDEEPFNKIAEISFIALTSYFESFFKNQFASIVNICPKILTKFLKTRPEIKLDINDILLFDGDISNKLGFIVAEQLDFGTPNKVNAIFFDLLSLHPFSKKEVEIVNKILNDRNLLVHHGGVYTMKYIKQDQTRNLRVRDDMFLQSLTVSKEDFQSYYNSLVPIVDKLVNASHGALIKYISDNAIDLSSEHWETIDAMMWD